MWLGPQGGTNGDFGRLTKYRWYVPAHGCVDASLPFVCVIEGDATDPLVNLWCSLSSSLQNLPELEACRDTSRQFCFSGIAKCFFLINVLMNQCMKAIHCSFISAITEERCPEFFFFFFRNRRIEQYVLHFWKNTAGTLLYTRPAAYTEQCS